MCVNPVQSQSIALLIKLFSQPEDKDQNENEEDGYADGTEHQLLLACLRLVVVRL